MDAAWIGVLGTLAGTVVGLAGAYALGEREHGRAARQRRRQAEIDAVLELQELVDGLRPEITRRVLAAGTSPAVLRFVPEERRSFLRGQTLASRLGDPELRRAVLAVFGRTIPTMTADGFEVYDGHAFEAGLDGLSPRLNVRLTALLEPEPAWWRPRRGPGGNRESLNSLNL